MLDKEIVFEATSGKVYPWAFPPWINDEVMKARLWEILSSEIKRALDELGIVKQKHPDSGSDSGRSDEPEGQLLAR
jgi:hypothetical protein